MSPTIILSSYNSSKSCYAVIEESKDKVWFYLCLNADQTTPSSVLGDVFVCNTITLIEHSELDRYKPNLPPITKDFGHQEAVCHDIHKIEWELHWLNDDTVLLTKDQKPWALISKDEKRGMSKAIKKSGPWGNNWNEKKYKKLIKQTH